MGAARQESVGHEPPKFVVDGSFFFTSQNHEVVPCAAHIVTGSAGATGGGGASGSGAGGAEAERPRR